MGYEPAIVRAATERHAEARERRAAALTARYDRARAAVPELGELDRQLRQVIARVVSAALTKGADPAAAVAEQREKSLALQRRRAELLRAAGFDPAELDGAPQCPRCEDAGWAKGKMCVCLRALCAEEQAKALSSLLDLGGQSFETFSLDWYGQHRTEMSMVLEICREYASRFGRYPIKNLYFHGKAGLGKTFLSASIARVVVQRGYSVVYDTAGSIFAAFEAQKFDRDEGAGDDTKRYLNCDLLILDDLGSEFVTPFVQSALYTVLNTRLIAGRHTIVSSNLSLKELDTRYEPQIVSRLRGEFRGLPFFGEDIRQQRKKKG